MSLYIPLRSDKTLELDKDKIADEDLYIPLRSDKTLKDTNDHQRFWPLYPTTFR